MLSKHVTKIVQNLEKKKFREKYNLFKIEGEKLVQELLVSGIKIKTVIAYPEWLEKNGSSLQGIEVIEVCEKEMHSISNFQSLPEVIALAEIQSIPVRKIPSVIPCRWCSTEFRIPETSERFSGWQTGSASGTFFATAIVPELLTRSVCRQAWELSSG